MHAQVAAPALAPFPVLSAPSVAPSGAALVPGGAPGSAGAPAFPTLGGPSLAPASGQVCHLGHSHSHGIGLLLGWSWSSTLSERHEQKGAGALMDCTPVLTCCKFWFRSALQGVVMYLPPRGLFTLLRRPMSQWV